MAIQQLEAGSAPCQDVGKRPAATLPAFERLLVCPYCLGPLVIGPAGASCAALGCGAGFARGGGVLDLRLARPKTVTRRVTFGAERRPVVTKRPLPANPACGIDWAGVERPPGLRARMQSHLPRARKAGAPMLDLGCGDASFRPIFARCGFDYVGVDVAGEGAMALADARALPFRDRAFELVWCNAVLQYVPHPEIALAEIHRVLEPGGALMGAIGFLETFDGDNMHQATWLGAHRYFHNAGFEIEHLAPDDEWTGPMALARALFPGLPHKAIDLIVGSVDRLSRLYWWLGTRRNPRLGMRDRLVKITGGMEFILRKR